MNVQDKTMLSTYFSDPPFEAQDTLLTWQEKNHPWLELSDVHKETTENIRVTVIPFYMGYRENQNTNVYWVDYPNCSKSLYFDITKLNASVMNN